MWTAIGLIFGFIFLVSLIVFLSKKYGQTITDAEMKKYELERMVKEQNRANKIIDSVRNMSYDECLNRLQNRKRK